MLVPTVQETVIWADRIYAAKPKAAIPIEHTTQTTLYKMIKIGVTTMTVSFKVLNAELQFHNDLKKYYELSCEFQAVHDKVYKTVRHSFDVNAEPADIFQIIEAAAKQFVSELINRLSNHGVFDRAASDYLNTNNGYLQLLNATTA